MEGAAERREDERKERTNQIKKRKKKKEVRKQSKRCPNKVDSSSPKALTQFPMEVTSFLKNAANTILSGHSSTVQGRLQGSIGSKRKWKCLNLHFN